MLPSPKEIYLRQWWWSKQPFWQYLDADRRGWANLVDKHPGLFNLAWAMAGAIEPPHDYTAHSAAVTWVFTEATYIPMKGRTMADWALSLSLPGFQQALVEDKRQIRRWRFHDKHVSYESVVQAINAACAIRA